jgi:hypothetical protein
VPSFDQHLGKVAAIDDDGRHPPVEGPAAHLDLMSLAFASTSAVNAAAALPSGVFSSGESTPATRSHGKSPASVVEGAYHSARVAGRVASSRTAQAIADASCAHDGSDGVDSPGQRSAAIAVNPRAVARSKRRSHPLQVQPGGPPSRPRTARS